MMGFDDLGLMLDRLCPMSVVLDGTGHIRHAGPTLQKLRTDHVLVGQRFLELVELNRPRAIRDMQELLARQDSTLHLQFRDEPRTALKGVLTRLPDGKGAVINLSFGISVLDAVRDYDLTSADFPATDLTIELLYLVEAKSAAMEASRKLNQRLQGAKIAAEEQAFTDTLTGLKNRRAMDHILSRLIVAGTPFSLMHLDLDFFKSVNDTMGHAGGDHVLQEAARIMVAQIREQDTVARVGGDEFVLIFNGLCDEARLGQIATRLIGELEKPMPFNGQTCKISASIGTVLAVGPTGAKAAQLLHDADLALYSAKRAGRACHRFFRDEMDDLAADEGGADTEGNEHGRITGVA
ncbi:MAG: diguanylate cyclase (GGDEF)-like protein [Paracoccaceae bacterium]|jgi:diguanylate cyclase (GGDEF)-like protein